MNTENFGKVEIIDNWVDEDLINHLSNQFLYRYPHFFVERSTPEGKPYMYSHDCRQSMDAQGDQGNQTLIWDSIRSVGYKNSVSGLSLIHI